MADKKATTTYKKCIVETTGEFELLDMSSIPMANIKENRPTVVILTDFIKAQRSDGNLRVLAVGLPMEADDKDFGDLFNGDAEKNKELAIKSFCSKFKLNADGEKIDTE